MSPTTHIPTNPQKIAPEPPNIFNEMMSHASAFSVIKRNGQQEPADVGKIQRRIQNLVRQFSLDIDVMEIVKKVISKMSNNIRTSELDDIAANTAVLMTEHPDYAVLASALLVSNLHKSVPSTFSAAVEKMHAFWNPETRQNTPLVSQELYDITMRYKDQIDAHVDSSRDYRLTYFSLRTLGKSYLLKTNDPSDPTKRVAVESPQYMWMRNSIGIHGDNLEQVFKTYDCMSKGIFTHATPTLFNAGTPHPQMSSCFLLSETTDSVDGIMDLNTQCAKISKSAGGIGFSFSRVRAEGSYINGTNGVSNGPIPFLRMINNNALAMDQGGGKRKGAYAAYMEPWHPDIMAFLNLRKNTTKEELAARDLFYGLMIPDEFMRRLERDEIWSLMCPNECPGLFESYGDEFDTLYRQYEKEGRFKSQIPARKLFWAIVETQHDTGMPYMLYKDHINEKSNQKNIGVIHNSNLCVAAETTVLTDRGRKSIQHLAGQTVNVWNGYEFTPAAVFQTSIQQALYRVHVLPRVLNEANAARYLQTGWATTDGIPDILENEHIPSNNYILDCTPYHKFLLPDGTRVEARTLKPGQKLMPYTMPEGHTIYPEVVRFEDTGRLDATYCLKEPKRQAAVFNDILTGNCTEIMEVSDVERVAVCNLLSLSLPAFVRDDTGEGSSNNNDNSVNNGNNGNNGKGALSFDFKALGEAVTQAVYNLNQVIDRNFYPVPEARYSNMQSRPMGIGVQGLADVFCMMGVPWCSQDPVSGKSVACPAARKLNQQIFETIYYYAVRKSVEMAKIDGPYPDYEGSPASQGKFQFDLWNDDRKRSFYDPSVTRPVTHCPELAYDWEGLRAEMAEHGIRNSLLVALMPTASTSQILGNYESFEPVSSNFYTRRVLSGEFMVVNKHLVKALSDLGLWDRKMHDEIIRCRGSVQNIPRIPKAVRDVFRTVWEIPQKVIVEMSADRSPFVDQGQSLNIHLANPTLDQMSALHIYTWKLGLKTGMYYLRNTAGANAVQFTVSKDIYDVYGRSECPWCHRTKDLLSSLAMEHHYHDIDTNPAARRKFESLKTMHGHNTVPLIMKNGQYLGGFTSLQAYLLAKTGRDNRADSSGCDTCSA